MDNIAKATLNLHYASMNLAIQQEIIDTNLDKWNTTANTLYYDRGIKKQATLYDLIEAERIAKEQLERFQKERAKAFVKASMELEDINQKIIIARNTEKLMVSYSNTKHISLSLDDFNQDSLFDLLYAQEQAKKKLVLIQQSIIFNK